MEMKTVCQRVVDKETDIYICNAILFSLKKVIYHLLQCGRARGPLLLSEIRPQKRENIALFHICKYLKDRVYRCGE